VIFFSFRASVMSGKNAGVQALLRQQYIPNAIFYSIISKIYTYFHA